MSKKNILTVAIAFVLGAIIGSPIVSYVYAYLSKTIEVDAGINIELDGEQFIPKDANGKEVEVFVYNGTTYLPIRAISNIYESDIEWDGERKTVCLFKKAEASKKDMPTVDELLSHKMDGKLNTSTIENRKELNLIDYEDNFKDLIVELKKIDKDFDAKKYKFLLNMYTEDGEDGIIKVYYYIDDKIKTNKVYVGIIEDGQISNITDSLKSKNSNFHNLTVDEEKNIIDKVNKFLKDREKVEDNNTGEKIKERKTEILYDYLTRELKCIDTKFIVSDELDGAIVDKTIEIEIEY